MSKMITLTINGVQYEIEDDGTVRFDSAQELTDEQKAQALANLGIEITVDDAFNADSENPVMNKVITAALTAAAQQLTAMDEAITALQGKALPAATTADNGKFLRVVDGGWAAVAVTNAEEESF